MKTLIFSLCLALAANLAVSADILSVELKGKRFSPIEATVKDGDSITICNRDTFFHSPFSYSKHNQFGTPKGIQIAPGQCMTHVARNPTRAAIPLKIFDELHSFEKLTITVEPGSGDGEGEGEVGSLTGSWRITQSGGYTGTLSISQSGERISGRADWDNHTRGSISGMVQGNKVTFTINYGDGLVGTYTAEIAAGGSRMKNGGARSNKGGAGVGWEAVRQ